MMLAVRWQALYAALESYSLVYYRKRPLRLLLCIAGVAIGSAAAGSIRLVNERILDGFQNSISSVAGRSTLRMTRPGGFAPAELERLRPLWRWASWSPYLHRRVVVNGGLYELYGLDFWNAELRRFQLASLADGAEAEATGPILGLSVPEDSPLLAAPSPLRLQIDGQSVALPIAARIRAMDGFLPPRQTIFADLGQLTPGAQRVDGAEFAAAPGTELQLRAELHRLFPQAAISSVAERKADGEEMLSAFRMNLSALALVSLAVSAFLVYNTVSLAALERRAALGQLFAMGASPRLLETTVLLEGALLGAAGALPGALLAALLGDLALEQSSAAIESVFRLSLGRSDWRSLAVLPGVVLLSIFFAALAAWFPARECSRTAAALARKSDRSQLQLVSTGPSLTLAALLLLAVGFCAWFSLRLNSPAIAMAAVAALLVAALALAAPLTRLAAMLCASGSAPAQLAAASLLQHQMRAAIAAAALAIALGVAGAVAVMVHSFRYTVDRWLQTAIAADIYVKAEAPPDALAGQIPAAAIDALRASAALQEVLTIRSTTLDYRGQSILLAADELELAVRRGVFTFAEGDANAALQAAQSDGAIVSESFATRTGKGPGDQLELFGRPIRIAAVYRSYSSERGVVLIDLSLYRQLFGERAAAAADGAALFLRPGVDAAAALQSVRAAVAGYALTFNYSAEVRRRALRIFDRTFALTRLLQWIAALVAALSLFSTLSGVAIERRRDFALLDALGARWRMLAAAVLLEALAIVLSALALAAPICAALSWLLIAVVNKVSFGWTIDASIPWSELLWTALLTLLLAALAAIAPVRLSLGAGASSKRLW
ncbi:MAG: ABC transporter permease [Leptospirales bacterium]|nr:ABC transporter permease [Leptospirales bacterium]